MPQRSTTLPTRYADDASNPAVADDHDELVYGGVLGQREDILRLDLAGERIVKRLPDLDAGDVGGDTGFDVRVLERQRSDLVGSVVLLDDHRAGAGVVGVRSGGGWTGIGDGAGNNPEFIGGSGKDWNWCTSSRESSEEARCNS